MIPSFNVYKIIILCLAAKSWCCLSGTKGRTNSIDKSQNRKYVSKSTLQSSCSYNSNARNILKTELSQNLFGQHIAEERIFNAVAAHISNDDPKKALVLSLHGSPGTGKNHVADILKNALLPSDAHFHVYLSSALFPDPSKIQQYKVELGTKIRAAVELCPLSIFVIDQVDKMPPTLIGEQREIMSPGKRAPFPMRDVPRCPRPQNVIRSLVEHHHSVDGVKYSKTIFFLLSNLGDHLINDLVLEHYNYWMPYNRERSKLTFQTFEKALTRAVFNTEGGLKGSTLIRNGLVDEYIPFLPLERIHVKQCIQAHLRKKRNFRQRKKPDLAEDETFVESIAETLQYFTQQPLFSSSGCKKISSRTDQALVAKDEL